MNLRISFFTLYLTFTSYNNVFQHRLEFIALYGRYLFKSYSPNNQWKKPKLYVYFLRILSNEEISNRFTVSNFPLYNTIQSSNEQENCAITVDRFIGYSSIRNDMSIKATFISSLNMSTSPPSYRRFSYRIRSRHLSYALHLTF